MSTSNTIPIISSGNSSLLFSPVASDFGAPTFVSGSVTTAVTDIVGGSAPFTGFPRNFLSVNCTDPSSGSVVLIPIIMPTILPDRFKLNFGISLGSAPPQDIVGGITFTNSGITKNLALQYQFAAVDAPYSPAISGGNIGGSSVAWQLPSGAYSRSVDSTLLFDSVQPFAVASPQLLMDLSLNTIGPPPGLYAKERFYGFSPSSGDMTTDLTGEVLKEPNLWFAFPTGFIGTVTFACWIDIQRHPEDNI